MLKSETEKLLREALNLIEDPDRWTKQKLALNANGEAVKPEHPEACVFCAEGALRSAFWKLYGQYIPMWTYTIGTFDRALKERGFQSSLWKFNDDDETDHSDIVDLFKTVIKENETA